MQRSIVSAVLAASCVLAASGEAGALQRGYVCGDGSRITVALDGASIDVSPIGGATVTLSRTGVDGNLYNQYERDGLGVAVAPDQKHIDVVVPEYGRVGCKTTGIIEAAASAPDTTGSTAFAAWSFPREAKSLGGSMRAGPGIDKEKVGSIFGGEKITVIEQARAPAYEDFPWFKVRYRGKIGYHWGGIICPIDGAVPGMPEECH